MLALPPRRPRRGFTIVEMVVVLVVLGLLLAFFLPKVGGSATFAEDEKAQTTASGALDAVTQLFVAAGERDGTGCTVPASTGPWRQMDGSLDATGAPVRDYGTAPLSPTNCPVFANTVSLAAANGDVRFVTGDQASTGSGVASVAAQKNPTGWRVAVAVLAPQGGTGHDTVSSCWISWHQFPAAAGGASLERFFTRTNIDAGDATNCTGDTALGYDTDAYCDAPSTDGSVPPLGRSWRRPCPDYPTS